MKGHCACVAEGASSHAIARAFGHCSSGGFDYPHDPSDLDRCIRYCRETGISTKRLVETMSGISPQWASLCSEWSDLWVSLDAERQSGSAPVTYASMRRLLDGSWKS